MSIHDFYRNHLFLHCCSPSVYPFDIKKINSHSKKIPICTEGYESSSDFVLSWRIQMCGIMMLPGKIFIEKRYISTILKAPSKTMFRSFKKILVYR
jgi:hypothetical protein